MLNVIWASRTVPQLNEIPKAINAIIREIPVTISALSSGILFIAMITFSVRFRIARMPIQAAVPISVAIAADARAMVKVFQIASIIMVFDSIS